MAEGRIYKKKKIPYQIKREIHIRDNFICQICGKKGYWDNVFTYEYKLSTYDNRILQAIRFEIDHILPEFLGGDNKKNNLQLACRKCNRRKGHKNGQKKTTRA